MALTGLGGIGKTQVALEFAYTVKRIRPEYSVFWITAMSTQSFEQSCTEIARTLGITQAAEGKEDAKELVKHQLSSEKAGRWFLIVDNADDMEIITGSEQVQGIADYLPHNEDGLVLFTTRTQKVAVALVGSNVVELDAMSRQEAVEFLRKSLIRKELLNNDSNTTKFLDELTYLPLAISQAAAYLNTAKISVSDYLRLLGNTEEDMVSVLSRELSDATRYKNLNNAVATTWLVSFNQILKHDPTAADLFSLMSCIEPKAIPLSILPSVQSKERMMWSLGTLCGYSFLAKRGEEEVYDMHRLVHLAIRIWVKKHRNAAETVEQMIQHVSNIFSSLEYDTRATWREYLSHALRLLSERLGREIKERYTLCFFVGKCLQEEGRIKEAIYWLEESYRWRQKKFPEKCFHKLESERSLANAYRADGQTRKAVELLEHIVEVTEGTVVDKDPYRLQLLHNLATAYQANNQIKKGVELMEHVCAVRSRELPEEHPSLVTSRHSLANAYQADGQTKKAVELLENVVSVNVGKLSGDHPHLLTFKHNLARAYLTDGQIKKAVELLEHVVAVRGKVLAEEHPDRLASQHSLASAYQEAGQIKKAVEHMQHVVAVRTRTLAEEHPHLLTSEHNLARAYLTDGQIKKAVELLEHVVAVRGRMLAEEHPDRLASQHALSLAYRADRQVGKAIKLLEHVVAVKAKVLRDGHPSRLVSQNTLAVMYAERR
jgi:tetratricopeptide (TPR) repeat protein